MKKGLLSLLLLLFSHVAFSQIHSADWWYFGFNAGIHFVGGSPVGVTDGAMYTWEGCSAISDTSGNLLFYTDGRKIWNHEHSIMPNGSGLLGDSSSTQSGMIVQLPGTEKLYYLFTVDEVGGSDGLQCNVINMGLDSGRGDVILKNRHLFSPVSEKISATYHATANGSWILVHEWLSNAFVAYFLGPGGLDTVPVISNVGVVHSGHYLNSVGYMKFSPDGSKIASVLTYNGSIEIFDFDASTGVVSNARVLPNYYQNIYGLEFSPDNSKLYISNFWDRQIMQFDLSSGSATTINNSKVIVATSSTIRFRGLQLGPDKKIYVSLQDNPYLGVINNPNNSGTACDYVGQGVYLGVNTAQYGLPNFMPSYFGPGHTLDLISIEEGSVNLYPVPAFNDLVVTVPNSEIDDNQLLSVYNMVGEKVIQSCFQGKALIDVSILQSGVYMLQVKNTTTGNVSVSKFIKQ